ncbi:MAG TPA: hypothetical protein VFX69_04805 [Steroidobacteraceae bacterium]|nr:hypothetical protein [Steroidobacteraceae bacterium]
MDVTQEILWKLAYTVFVVVIVEIWRRHYGWRNLLWFSDIALIGAVPALWLESAAIASVLAVAVLLPEILWNVDFGLRLVLRRRITGLTDYMFERERPRLLRVLSALFHVPLPVLLLWMLAEYGYDASAGLPGAVVLAAIVLPWSRAVGTPERNINWTYGLGAAQTRLPAQRYLAQLFAGFVLVVFMPTHLALQALFPPPS